MLPARSMRYAYLLVAAASLFQVSMASAQIEVEWATSFQHPDSANLSPLLSGVSYLPTGDVAAYGYYSSAIDFDRDGVVDLVHEGGTDGFVALFGESGTLIRAMRLGGSDTARGWPISPCPSDCVLGLDHDQGNNLYLIGHFVRAIDLNSDGQDDLIVPEPDSLASFVAKYSNSGTLEWSKMLPHDQTAAQIAIDRAANKLIVVSRSIDNFISAIYTTYMTLDGAVDWQVSLDPIEGEPSSAFFAQGVVTGTDGDIYLAGGFNGVVDFDGPGPMEVLTTRYFPPFGRYLSRMFVLKYTNAGVLEWVRTATGDASSGFTEIGIYKDQLILTGPYDYGALTFSESDTTYTIPEKGADQIVHMSYSTEGEILWIESPDHSGSWPFGLFLVASDMSVDTNGNSFITGAAFDAVDFDHDGVPDTPTEKMTMFVAQYNLNGQFQQVYTFETGSGWLLDADSANRLILAGSFNGSIDLDGPGPYPSITSMPGNDFELFLTQLRLPDQTLPVELLTFTALAAGDAVTLSWTTASETNNAGFDVQHRVDDTWKTIAHVPGNGTTVDAHDYRHPIDRLAPGRHVFRLRQVDFDGAFTFSAEAETTVAAGAALVLGEAYPNPFNPQTTFTVALARSGWVNVALYDALGRQVRVLHEGPLAGEASHRFVIDGSGLPSGVYLVRAVGGAYQASTRVLLVK